MKMGQIALQTCILAILVCGGASKSMAAKGLEVAHLSHPSPHHPLHLTNIVDMNPLWQKTRSIIPPE